MDEDEVGFVEEHRVDDQGRPAGGCTLAIGINIQWQNGPLVDETTGHRLSQSGAFVEDVVRAAIGRIAFYQSGEFACRENALALTKLQEALHWLNHRTADREARGVEGTHQL
jgi:hypothetical protein